jgi:hypothetical protein
MRYWIREVGGWGLVGLGLLVFYGCYQMLLRKSIVETGSLMVIGIFVFRGGIHLLKIAVAAQVCLRSQDRADQEEAGGRHPSAVGRRPHPSRAGSPQRLGRTDQPVGARGIAQ